MIHLDAPGRPASDLTEAGARAALRAFVATGGIEQWIAARPWRPAQGGGWASSDEGHGWGFRIEPVAGGLRIAVHELGLASTWAWFVPRVGIRRSIAIGFAASQH